VRANQEYLGKMQMLLMTQRNPMTAKYVAEYVGCSLSTAYRLIKRDWYGFGVWRPDGHGNFRFFHFPVNLTLENVIRWMDESVKRGRSRAEIKEIARGGKLIRVYRRKYGEWKCIVTAEGKSQGIEEYIPKL